MTDEPVWSLTPRQIEALRSCALHPKGLRKGAYPSAMPVLNKLGLVAEKLAGDRRRKDQTAWFLTPLGREALREGKRAEPP